MWIELLEAVGEHAAGDQIDVKEETARKYIAAGIAKDAGDSPNQALLAAAGQRFADALGKVTKDAATAIDQATENLRRPRIEVVTDEADQRGRSLGDQVQLIYRALGGSSDPEVIQKAHNRLTTSWKDGGYGSKRGMAEGQGSTGGYLTAVTYESQIFEVMAENGVIVPGATEVPLGTRQVEWPALNQYTVPTAGQSAFFGGVQIFRKSENAQRTASQPSFAKITLAANDMTAYTEISRDELEDSTAVLDAKIPQLFGLALGWREDWEALNGTGSGQFLGIYNSPGSLILTRNTGGTIVYQDVFGMFVRMISQGKKNAVWVCHPYTIQTLMQLVDPANHFIMLPYYSATQGALQNDFQYRMLGLNVLESEKAPTLGNTGDLILVDRSKYLVGRRSGIEIGLSEHFKFDTDQVAMRAKVRNDGQLQMKKPITLADGTKQVSAAVILQ